MPQLTQFNIWDEDGRLLCTACGFDTELQIPRYTEDEGLPIFICEACLWEPGLDDAHARSPDEVLVRLRDYRKDWGQTAPWDGSGDPPPDWDGKRQLAHLFAVAPHVR